MSELNYLQKVVVIETVKSWPKEVSSEKLLELLDIFARKILEAK